MTSWNFSNFGPKVPYEATHNQASIPTYAPSSLLTCFYSPRYNTVKKPVSVTIWRHGDTWELELTCSKKCIGNGIAEVQRKHNDNTRTSTVHKPASNEFKLNATPHLVIPYSECRVKIRLVALLSACSLMQLMHYVLNACYAFWRQCVIILMVNKKLNQTGFLKELDPASNRLPPHIWQWILYIIIVNTHSKYSQLVSMRTSPNRPQNIGGLRKNLLHVQRVTPLPLPDGGLTRRCPISGTSELQNDTTYNEKHNTDKLIWQLLIIATNNSCTPGSSAALQNEQHGCYTLYKLTSPKYTSNVSSERHHYNSMIQRDDIIYLHDVPADNNMCLSTPVYAISIKTNDNAHPLSAHSTSPADCDLDSETYSRPYRLDISVSVACRLITQFAPILPHGKLTVTAHRVNQEPRDGERDEKSAAGTSSSSSIGSQSHTSRATVRRGIQRNRSGYSYVPGDNDDDDGERDRRPQRASKIKSQCENELPLNLTPIKTKLDENCIEISLNEEEVGDSTLFGRLSKQLLDTFSNMTLFGAHPDKHETSGDMDSTFSLNISIASVSQLDQTQTQIIQQQNFIGDDWPTPIIHVTPAKSPQEELENHDKSVVEDTNKNGECYFTGRGNPVITPVNRQKNLLVLPRSCRGRLRSRSYSSNQPYKIPPAEAIRKKLRLRVDSQLVGGTPVRKRSPSESDINFAESFEIPRNEISCIKIQDAGYHDCSAGREYLIHLEHDFLQAESSPSRPALISALEEALKNGQRTPSGSATPERMYELQRTVALDWDLNSVQQLLDQLNDHDLPKTVVDKDPLLYLLGKLIQHQRDIKTSKPDVLYNSLEITSIVGRGHKLVLNDVYDTAEEGPLLVLHMGKERAMNIIPKKLNLAMLDVFDVQLGNFSLMSISHKTKDSMHISLPKEKALEDDDLDLHILVKPQLKSVTLEKLDGDKNGNKSDVTQEPAISSEEHSRSAYPVLDSKLNGAEDLIVNEEPDHDAIMDTHNVTEESKDCEEQSASEEPDHDATMDTHNVTEESKDCEEQSTSEEPDHDATRDTHNVTEEHKVGEEPVAAMGKPNGAEAEVHNAGEEHIKITLPTQDDIQPESMSSKNKEIHDDVERHFISTKICVRLLNSHRKESITAWLTDCGLPVPKKKKPKVHKLREQLLKYIQSIHDGKTKPTMFFASSFLGKLPFSELLEEAKRLKIYFPKTAHETEVRRSINEYFTAEGEGETERPVLLTTDEELSPSESETEEKSTAKKSNGGGRGKVKQENPDQTKHVNKTRSGTGLSAKNPDKPERCKKQHTATGHIITTTSKEEEAVPLHHQKFGDDVPHLPYEKSILTLEQSLIEVQDRLSAQEVLIESISNRSTLEQQTSTLKSLQSKNRTFFDTLNTQQSSIDTIKDSLAENSKESKKRLKKFSQLQGTVTNNAKQGQEALAELKQDVHDWMKACEVMFTELRQQIEPITQTTTQLQNEIKKLKQDLVLLKSSGYTKGDHQTDSKEEENVINAQISTSADVALIAEISKLREDNKAHFARLDKQLKSIALNNQRMTPSSKKENARTTASVGPHGIDSNQSKSSNTETSATVPQNPRENIKINETGQMEREINQRPSQKKNDSTSSFSSEQNIQENPHKVTSRGAASGESKCDNANEPTNQADEPPHFKPGGKARHRKSTTSRFATRKCLIIHDPYFRGFDESKFSRWFDVTTAGFESLKHVVTSKTLPSKVKAINPEVVFLHVGQADLLDKESGNKVLQEFKKLIKNILTHTPVKLCVSQMIPTGKIPQVDSVIKQVNKELSNHISKLRTEDTELRKRVFTCNNDSLGSCITQSVGKHGIELSLNDRGQRKLWLNLRDGLNRSLSLNHPNKKESNPNTQNNNKTPHKSRPDHV